MPDSSNVVSTPTADSSDHPVSDHPEEHPVSADVSDDDQSHQQQHRLRLCKLRRWPNYSGYGFNLHVYATKATSDGETSATPAGPDLYVIGAVEPGSPAEASGLRRGDRVVEVNGQKVILDTCHGDAGSTSSLDAVAMIRARPDRVNLLVADETAYLHFIESGVHLDSSQSFVDVITCPETAPAGNDGLFSVSSASTCMFCSISEVTYH
jgi:PDZ domain